MPKPVDTTYYDLLGVSPDVDENQLKKAYKKSALKYHPDRVQGDDSQKKAAETKFKEISEAYSVLSDKNKRSIYDQVGVKGMKEGAGETPDFGSFGGFGDAFNMFNTMFGGGGGGMFGGGGKKRSGPHNKPSPNTQDRITISLRDAYNGKNIKKTISRNVKCNTCNGLGVKSKTDIITCTGCNGSGMSVNIQRSRFGIIQSTGTCQQCSGKGTSIRSGSECTKCKGKKYIREPKELNLNLPAGSHTGMKLIVKNMSDWMPDYLYIGDLELNVIIEDTVSEFKLQEKDLILHKKLSLIESLTGTSFGIRHLDDHIVMINYDKPIKCLDVLKVSGEGMPILANDRGRYGGKSHGDLIIQFDIEYPESFNQQQLEILKKIIPHTRIKQSPEFNIDINKAQEAAKQNNKIKLTQPNIQRMSSDDKLKFIASQRIKENSQNNSSRHSQHSQQSHSGGGGIPGMPGMDNFEEIFGHSGAPNMGMGGNVQQCTHQ